MIYCDDSNFKNQKWKKEQKTNKDKKKENKQNFWLHQLEDFNTYIEIYNVKNDYWKGMKLYNQFINLSYVFIWHFCGHKKLPHFHLFQRLKYHLHFVCKSSLILKVIEG